MTEQVKATTKKVEEKAPEKVAKKVEEKAPEKVAKKVEEKAPEKVAKKVEEKAPEKVAKKASTDSYIMKVTFLSWGKNGKNKFYAKKKPLINAKEMGEYAGTLDIWLKKGWIEKGSYKK